MSEAVEPSVGQVLRNAREAQRIALEDAAARLRLMHRQIEAMETDDFDSLGQPVFARGFVRNYARMLGLAPDALLARMEGAPAEPAAVIHVEPPLPRSWLTSPWLILLLLGVLVAVAAPVALYWWLNEGEEEVPPPASAVERSKPLPPALPALIAEPEKLSDPAVQPAPIPSVAPAAEATQPAEAVPPTPPVVPASPVVPGPTGLTGELHLEFGEESWVEIKDASGRMLHRQLNPPGSSVNLSGQPPFDLVIGNASRARMTYNGRPIDLKPFIDVTVARFTLEE